MRARTSNVRRPSAVVAAALVALGSLVACAGVLAIDDVSYLEDGGSPVSDAAIDVTARADASTDAADRDVAELDTGDGGMDGDAAPLSFGCRFLAATFCVDFEGIGVLDAAGPTWTSTAYSASTLELTTDGGFSPIHAARFTEPRDAGCSNTGLVRTFSKAFSSYSARFAARFETAASPAILHLDDGGAGTFYQLLVGLDSDRLWVMRLQKFMPVEGGVVGTTPAIAKANLDVSALGPWTPIEVRVEPSADGGMRAVARLGDTTVMVDPLPPEVPLRNPSFAVGSWCAAQGTTLTIDDVVIDLTP